MPDPNDHIRQLNTELDELRRSLVRLRAQLSLPSPAARRADALEATHKHLNALKTCARLLETDLAEARVRANQLEREAWSQKVRRADATAKLKARERLLEQIQQSPAWKVVKPIWKLLRRSSKPARDTALSSDLAFALDLPKRWKTSREIILIKGWCFSRSGRPIAGVRAKAGSKARIAHYGLERLDVVSSFPEYPEARQSGSS
jgi:chromosome segregation ATPase